MREMWPISNQVRCVGRMAKESVATLFFFSLLSRSGQLKRRPAVASGRGHSWGETLLSPFSQTLRMKHQQKPQIHQHLLVLLDKTMWDSAVNSLWPQHLFNVKPASPQDPQMLSVHILRDSHWQRIWKETVTDPKEIWKCKHITGSRVCLS